MARPQPSFPRSGFAERIGDRAPLRKKAPRIALLKIAPSKFAGRQCPPRAARAPRTGVDQRGKPAIRALPFRPVGA